MTQNQETPRNDDSAEELEAILRELTAPGEPQTEAFYEKQMEAAWASQSEFSGQGERP